MYKYLTNKAITEKNVEQYIAEKFGKNCTARLQSKEVIQGLNPLLQNDYGLAGDCTVTSMTFLLVSLYHKPVQEVYDIVEAIDKKYGYNGERGTIPLLINSILRQAEQKLNKKPSKWRSGYIKNVGFNFNTIMKCVKQNKPMILSMTNDGRGYYSNHSVSVVGYAQYVVDNHIQRFLIVYDNWTKEESYIDYDIMWSVCSLNY